jgi:exosome complex component RRP41
MITPFSGNERKKRKMGDRRSQEIETIVKNTFESVILLDLYQQSEIIIVVHVFESDGSLICSILNATTLAMIDAGINMKDMVASCSVGVFKQLIYKDVTQTEQISGSAYIPVATQGLNKGILYIQLDSRISLDLLETAVEKAIEGCSEIHLALAEITKAHIIAIDSS